jgi:hypothetical protein
MGGSFPKWETAIFGVGFSAESAKSKPEPFLHEPQKKFGTPRVSVVLEANSGAARRIGHPPRLPQRGIILSPNPSIHFFHMGSQR